MFHDWGFVQIIEKMAGHSRARVFKEIEIFHHCKGHPNIIQLIEYFEEDDRFFLVFEKIRGGPLLTHIQRRIHFTEHEASLIIADLANALAFLHEKVNISNPSLKKFIEHAISNRFGGKQNLTIMDVRISFEKLDEWIRAVP